MASNDMTAQRTATLQSLADLLQRDLDALQAGQVAAMAGGHRQKLAALALVRDEFAALITLLSDKAKLNEVPDLTCLQERLKELTLLAEQHRRGLAGAIDATKERIHVVIDARRRAAVPHEVYGPSGAIRFGPISRHALTMNSRKI